MLPPSSATPAPTATAASTTTGTAAASAASGASGARNAEAAAHSLADVLHALLALHLERGRAQEGDLLSFL
jgi:hypothetical protein